MESVHGAIPTIKLAMKIVAFKYKVICKGNEHFIDSLEDKIAYQPTQVLDMHQTLVKPVDQGF